MEINNTKNITASDQFSRAALSKPSLSHQLGSRGISVADSRPSIVWNQRGVSRSLRPAAISHQPADNSRTTTTAAKSNQSSFQPRGRNRTNSRQRIAPVPAGMYVKATR